VGKSLDEEFYGEPHSKSYYLGCSLGGRQGIGSAEKFPKDFDGIVAGAPGVDFNNLISWRAHFFTVTGAIGTSNFIPATAWKTWIHKEVLRQCDMNDGVQDGIIEDPNSCIFHPTKLLCTGTAKEECLSNEQIVQLMHILSEYKYPNGQVIFPAMQSGSEVGAASGLYAGTPWAYSEGSQLAC
jgi:feruloyl esterase